MERIDREDKASRTTFRLAIGAAAAALLAAAGLTAVLLGGDDDPGVENPKDPHPTTTSTVPAGPIRQVDFLNRTYTNPCPSLESGDVTLDDGSAFVPTGDSNGYSIEGSVGYADVTGDDVEDAVVLIFCHHQRADVAAAWAGAYQAGAAGTEPTLVGQPLVIDYDDQGPGISTPPEVAGGRVVVETQADLTLTEHLYRFDGRAFREVASPIRQVDFRNRTYHAPCPAVGLDGDVQMSLAGGGLGYVFDVVYGDLDGDGEDDALVGISCTPEKGEGGQVWVGAFTIGAGGKVEALGEPLRSDGNVAPYETTPTIDGNRVVVASTREPGGAPYDLIVRTWEFDGTRFEKVDQESVNTAG